MRKQGVTYSLTFDDAVEIWHLHWDGVFQHRIAASFDVNPGRVSEVIKEHKHSGSKKAAQASYKKRA